MLSDQIAYQVIAHTLPSFLCPARPCSSTATLRDGNATLVGPFCASIPAVLGQVIDSARALAGVNVAKWFRPA